MKKALLVGGSGFIGSALRRTLMDRGVDVTSVDHSFRDVQTPLDEPLEMVDVVFHLAQSPNYRRFPDKAREMFLTNVFSVNEYCAAAIATARLFVLFSSGSIFGVQREIITRQTLPAPIDFYGYTKLAAEGCLNQYRSFYSTLTLRPFTPYGPGQVDRLVPSLAARIRTDEPIDLHSSLRLSLLHIDDLVDLTLAAADRALSSGGSHVFNMAHPDVIGLTEVVDALSEGLGMQPRVNLVHSSPITYVAADCEEFYDWTGVAPRTTPKDGLRALGADLVSR